jgi:hypothetical protein
MKILHKIPTLALTSNMTGKISDDYQRQVDRSTARLEMEFLQAQKALKAAERRAERAVQNLAKQKKRAAVEKSRREEIAAWEAVEVRRMELQSLARLMSTTPAGSANRGTESFKKVPITHGGNI